MLFVFGIIFAAIAKCYYKKHTYIIIGKIGFTENMNIIVQCNYKGFAVIDWFDSIIACYTFITTYY